MDTSLKIYTVDTANNATAKTISKANPAASDYVLKTFAEKYNSLSSKTLLSVERIDTSDITHATNE